MSRNDIFWTPFSEPSFSYTQLNENSSAVNQVHRVKVACQMSNFKMISNWRRIIFNSHNPEIDRRSDDVTYETGWMNINCTLILLLLYFFSLVNFRSIYSSTSFPCKCVSPLLGRPTASDVFFLSVFFLYNIPPPILETVSTVAFSSCWRIPMSTWVNSSVRSIRCMTID